EVLDEELFSRAALVVATAPHVEPLGRRRIVEQIPFGVFDVLHIGERRGRQEGYARQVALLGPALLPNGPLAVLQLRPLRIELIGTGLAARVLLLRNVRVPARIP